MTQEEAEAIATKAVVATLARFGIEDGDHKELAADFMHLRRWRKSVEQAQGYTFKVVITTIVGGVLGAIWLGLQAMLHR
ncbi:hypothetical protein GA0061099_103913 [Bradyrhizobium yuanmingense]|uniref:Uncharacterized protein n=1 Tax=Bradyrhizobium yuanmingense TaxID=108015 RepID=A0A1C3XKE6_9BRAD|nr:hypothetical protein [Bradyrhizobium yuanmingense]TWI19002.1 hypothetical protein IQ15_07028 [Bradyrhizobium yuanmingense]SCB52738.1 hypothetical protein GA0061099_103913 [Bradyrhizobium yuanmingense]